MLWRTALGLTVGHSRRAVWSVWGGALIRMSLMVGVLWLAVRASAVSAVLAAVGFLGTCVYELLQLRKNNTGDDGGQSAPTVG